jgi:hypothetical protein
MKNLKFAFLTVAIGIALSLTAKAETDAAAEAILGPLGMIDDIKTCQTTLKNLDQLIKLSAELMVITQGRRDRSEDDPSATSAIKANAQADYQAAINDYGKLLAWREHVSNRIAYDQVQLGGMGMSAAARDAAKDGAWEAAKAAASDVRGSVKSTVDGMRNCPDGH